MAAKGGKRKLGESVGQPGTSKTSDEDELNFFVDAPLDSDGSGASDTTDSEESEYSGLEEEEDTSDEEIADEESDKDESEEESDESANSDVSDQDDASNNNKPTVAGNSHAKTKAPKERTKLLTKKQAKLSARDKMMKNEKNNTETVTKQIQHKQASNIATSNIPLADEYEFDSSDEEDIRNTVGNIPMEWYREYDHIGYDIEGRKLIKPKVGDSLDEFLNKMENPDYWRTVKDRQTGQKVILSDNDIELIRRFRHGKYIDPNYNPYEPWVDFFTHEKSIHPVTNHPPQKRSFIPSKWEKLKVGQMVHAIKMGWIKPRKPPSEEEEDQYYNLWTSDDVDETIRRMRSNIPAPKMALPGHAESYNPPPEYLLTEEEELAWKEQDPEDRKMNFIPKKYSSLRLVPSYSRFINERFERCLDLYLCPRQRKMRMNVNPEDLLPKLPKPKDLQPFPTVQAIVYKGHEGFVRSFSVDPTGQWLCSGSDDKTVRFWEVSTGRCMKTMKVPGIVKCVAWNPNSAFCLVAVAVEETIIILNPMLGDKLVISNTDNMISAYTPPEDLENKIKLPVDWRVYEESEVAAGLRLKVTHPKTVSKVTWHSRGDYLSVVQEEADSMAVLIHQLSKRRTQNPFKKSKGRVQCVLFHPTRPFFFVATQRYVRVYNLLKQELSKKLMTNVKWVSSMAVHPGGDNLIIGSYDCRLSWFDLDLSNKPYQTLRHHKQAIRAVAYHPKYPLFASASDDGSVIVCHGRVFNDLLQNPLIVPVKVLRGHTPHKQLGVLDCQFHPTQPWVFSSASDCTIRLFS